MHRCGSTRTPSPSALIAEVEQLSMQREQPSFLLREWAQTLRLYSKKRGLSNSPTSSVSASAASASARGRPAARSNLRRMGHGKTRLGGEIEHQVEAGAARRIEKSIAPTSHTSMQRCLSLQRARSTYAIRRRARWHRWSRP